MRYFIYFTLMILMAQPACANVNFLCISDIHYGSKNTPGDGHDTDDVLFASAMNELSQLSNDVDFILTLGDLPTHLFGYAPEKETYVKKVFHDLFQADKSAKPMFYLPGNNDSLQGNYQPFSVDGKSPLSLASDWQGACAHCEGLVIDGSHQLEGGYYSSYVIPNNKDIILIALNSIQFTHAPFFILPKYPHQDRDALQQLLWLDGQLQQHKAKQLLIAMHVPPGNDYKGSSYWHDHYLKQFIDLLTRASSNYEQITLLTSHSHMDDIRRIHLNNGKTIYAYSTPSISRIHNNNPAMKIFELNSNLELADYTTYYTKTDSPWQNTHYSAIKSSHSLFPSCDKLTLHQCLDSLNKEAICNAFQTSHQLYGENPRVNQIACHHTFSVN